MAPCSGCACCCIMLTCKIERGTFACNFIGSTCGEVNICIYFLILLIETDADGRGLHLATCFKKDVIDYWGKAPP